MKGVTIVAKDNNYSLQNIENYKNPSSFEIGETLQKYSDLIIEYFKFVMDNIKIKNSSFSKFIVIRGLDTITNVFFNILYFTRNIDLTYFHSQKSYYFYVEFVGQISDDEKMFLQLTSRDATTYVYKKTVFDINNEFKKMNEEVPAEFREKLDIIKSYIHLYQTYLLKIIHMPVIEVSYVIHLKKLSEKVNNLLHKQKISALENITEKLYNKIECVDKFFDISHLLVKKFLKNQEILRNAEKKIYTEEFDNKLVVESNDKFINWLLS
jgi:hypothetical protein